MAPSFFFDFKKKVSTYHKAGQGYAKTNTTRSNEGSIPHPPADSQSHPAECFHAAASATRDLSRVFTPWSHVVALIYQQLTKTESFNGVCDAARLHASQWQELRGAVPPRRNTFSNANQNRDPTMMETLYW